MRQQVGCACMHLFFQANAGFDPFAVIFAGHRKGRSLQNRLMFEQRLINFAWRNILTAFDDQFFDAARYKHISILVQISQIAGFKPAIG